VQCAYIIPDYISRKTKHWKDLHINIAIVGETYVGKSTFINQLRGLKEWDNGFASVGIGDTTLEPTPSFQCFVFLEM
jgi:ribosome biogenesis GTPase A